MQLCIDLDIALFSVRHKLDKECRAYYFFRELCKDDSGYLSRKGAISAYMEAAKASYGTANRRVNALIELGWAVKAKKGNIHINGVYRVKTLLHEHFAHKMGFVWRRRTALVDLFAGENTLDNWKGGLTAALTADKLSRSLTKAKAGLAFEGKRASKAEIGTALAQIPNLGCYAHTLKCRDWNLSAGTVNRRKKVSEALKLELYDWQRVDGLCFASRDEAIQGAIALGYVDRHYRKVFYKDGSYGLRGADKIRTRVELKRRAKVSNAKPQGLSVKIAGQKVSLSPSRVFGYKDYWFYEEDQQFIEKDPFEGCVFDEKTGELLGYTDSFLSKEGKGMDISKSCYPALPKGYAYTPYSAPLPLASPTSKGVGYRYGSSFFEKE